MRTKLSAPILTNDEIEMINEQKNISKGNLTRKELALIKKKIKASVPKEWECKINKYRSSLSIDLTPSENYLNFNKIILDGIERVNTGPLICGNDELETFRDEIKNFLGQFNIIFEKGDSMTDLPSTKRYYYFVTLTFKDQCFSNIKKITKELYKINQAQNTSGFYIADFNRFAGQFGLEVRL